MSNIEFNKHESLSERYLVHSEDGVLYCKEYFPADDSTNYLVSIDNGDTWENTNDHGAAYNKIKNYEDKYITETKYEN